MYLSNLSSAKRKQGYLRPALYSSFTSMYFNLLIDTAKSTAEMIAQAKINPSAT